MVLLFLIAADIAAGIGLGIVATLLTLVVITALYVIIYLLMPKGDVREVFTVIFGILGGCFVSAAWLTFFVTAGSFSGVGKYFIR